MYDFSKFIDLLNQYESEPQKALDIIKADFPIGRIQIKSDSLTTLYDFPLADGYKEDINVEYSNHEYRYFAYAKENKRLDRFIKTMNKNGILTAIDDFGTGYSSLSVIRDFKVSEIKIDRSFIDRDRLTKKDEIIIGSIINMAKSLDISIICEGVETKEQAEFLSELGCKNAQGYLYCKPLPKLEFEALMQKTGTVYDDLD